MMIRFINTIRIFSESSPYAESYSSILMVASLRPAAITAQLAVSLQPDHYPTSSSFLN